MLIRVFSNKWPSSWRGLCVLFNWKSVCPNFALHQTHLETQRRINISISVMDPTRGIFCLAGEFSVAFLPLFSVPLPIVPSCPLSQNSRHRRDFPPIWKLPCLEEICRGVGGWLVVIEQSAVAEGRGDGRKRSEWGTNTQVECKN